MTIFSCFLKICLSCKNFSALLENKYKKEREKQGNSFYLLACPITLPIPHEYIIYVMYLSAMILLFILLFNCISLGHYLCRQGISAVNNKMLLLFMNNPILFSVLGRTSFWILSLLIMVLLYNVIHIWLPVDNSSLLSLTDPMPLENTITVNIELKDQDMDNLSSKTNNISINDSNNQEGFWSRNKDKIMIFAMITASICLFVYAAIYMSSAPSSSNIEGSMAVLFEKYEKAVLFPIFTSEQIMDLVRTTYVNPEDIYMLKAKETYIFISENIPEDSWNSRETFTTFKEELQSMLDNNKYTLEQKRNITLLDTGLETFYTYGPASVSDDVNQEFYSRMFWVIYKRLYISSLLVI